MATAAFKSTTKRTSMGASSASSTDDSSSSNRNSSAHRRTRSLSRFSRHVPPPDTANELDEFLAPRGRFVNTVRGSGFPEISLDDLAIEVFESANRGRLTSGHSEPSPGSGLAASQRRGRSVSRKSTGVSNDGRGNVGSSASGGRAVSDANQRRRRSLSVVRYQISDSESDLDHSQNSKIRANLKSTDNGNKLMHKPVASDQRSVLRRSVSQKDLRSYDGSSSQSSVLTDDEGTGAHFNKNGIENKRATIYSQKKAEHSDIDSGLHKARRKEIRHAVDGIKMEIEQAGMKPRTSTLTDVNRLLSNNSDVIQAVSSIKRNYETELEQSEKRKQDLLAEIVLEEQRGRELSKIFKELLPDTKIPIPKPSRPRKRSNDRSRMSKCLTEEAERYIEDFISNVEDTDISSLDGERSDTSSSVGGLIKSETFNNPPLPRSLPIEMDGVTLPWLQWETINDVSPTTSLNKTQMPVTPKTASFTQEITKAQEQNLSVSSHGSWSPNGLPEYIGKDLSSKFGESYNYQSQSFPAASKGLKYDMDEYLRLKNSEDLLIERWRQQHRINSGSLLLCNIRF